LEQALGIAGSHPQERSSLTKNAVITHTLGRSRVPARDGHIDDPARRLANTRGAMSHSAIFSESSFSTLSDFLILSVARRAFSIRAD
jgi:hypothetical protein